jgi:hypothetical protein
MMHFREDCHHTKVDFSMYRQANRSSLNILCYFFISLKEIEGRYWKKLKVHKIKTTVMRDIRRKVIGQFSDHGLLRNRTLGGDLGKQRNSLP